MRWDRGSMMLMRESALCLERGEVEAEPKMSGTSALPLDMLTMTAEHTDERNELSADLGVKEGRN